MEVIRHTIFMVITLTGTVISVNRVDLDKSGKHPNYMIFIKLNVESVEKNDDNVSLDSVITIQAKESDFFNQLGCLPRIGDSIVISSQVTEKYPKKITLGNISFKPNKINN